MAKTGRTLRVLQNHEILAFLLVIGIILAVAFGIWYFLIYVIFWAFGPTIFGLVFSYKIVIGAWVVSGILSTIFGKKGK